MTTFQEHKAKTSSEKIVLAWVEPSQRLFGWTVHAGSVYKRVTSYYVVGVRQDGTAFTEVASIAAVDAVGKWYFDSATKTLYVRSTGSVDPGTLWTDVTYRLFFSNAPIDLPADLASGVEVPYEARIRKTSKFKAKFDPDQKGIALEGAGSISFHNMDGYFADIYDRMTWENKRVVIYSYGRGLDVAERITLFNGVVTNKDFDDSTVTFTVKDFIYRLRTDLDLPVYASTDGDLPDSLLGKPKRRVYGRVDGLLCAPISNMRSSYELQTIVADARSGTPLTISLTQGSTIGTASGTDIHKELVAGDTLVVRGTKYKVKSLARIDIGLDTSQEVTVSRTSGTVARLAFSGISTTNVTVGDHITLSVLSNASQDTKSKIIGHFPIAVVNASYLEFTLPTSIASLSDVFKTGIGEVAITRQSNTTSFTLQQESTITLAGETITVEPVRPYRRFNRSYLVAHHALSTRSTTVTSVISSVKFALANVTGMYEGDTIRINGTSLSTVTALNSEAKIITVADVVLPLPVIGQTVERLGVQRVTYQETDYTQFTDFNPSYNSSIGASIVFDNLAEFNAADTEGFTSRLKWYNGSKQVQGSNDVFREVQVRDWVSSDTDGVWYEVAEKFSNNLLILSTPYTGTTGENLTSFKRPVLIDDKSKIIAEVYGKTVEGTEAGTLIGTAAAVVNDLVTDSGLSASINAAAFTDAGEAAPFLISMALPYKRDGRAPKIREIINLLNDSVAGSLYSDIDGQIRYKVLDASRAVADTTQLTDSDVLGYSVAGDSTKILRKVLMRYGARDADTVTEEETFSVAQASSTYITNTGIDGQVETFTTALYNATDAETMAQRTLFVNELAKSRVSFTVKLQLADAVLNDLVTIDLARLYERFGTSGTDTTKTGLIQAIEKDGINVGVTIDDLGNIFNRVAVVTANDADTFTAATEAERRHAGYITSNVGLVDDDESTYNANLIG